ncbi:MAG: PaaI family thioesterase [Rhizobiaceae bacterium]
MKDTTLQVANWLNISANSEPGLFQHCFADYHVGNPFIRSLHGGVTAALTEYCAEQVVIQELGESIRCRLTSSSMNYLRVTKSEDVFVRATITRLSRRMAFVDVFCWQDNEANPVTKGQCNIRIIRAD